MKYIRTYNSAHTLGAEIQFSCVLQLLDTQQGSVMVQDHHVACVCLTTNSSVKAWKVTWPNFMICMIQFYKRTVKMAENPNNQRVQKPTKKMDPYWKEPIDNSCTFFHYNVAHHRQAWSVYLLFICQHAGAYVSDGHGWYYCSVGFSSASWYYMQIKRPKSSGR